ncbi:hypothetical protein AAVH_40119 [Aphelenchoides avenae]|nr:hypothetical protein AAVH_40119 [Aphelenchus avenae]
MQPIRLAERRVRLALEGYIDVFKLLSRDNLSTLEISHRKFRSIVAKHMSSVCLIAVDIARVEQLGGYIALDGKWIFRAVDESHTEPAPRVASKCLIKRMLINYLANIDDVACKALIDIQPNVQVVTFDSRGKGAIVEDQRESVFSLQGVRLSSEFFLKVLKAHTSNVLSENFSCSIYDSEADEQNRGPHHFVETEDSTAFVLEQQNLSRLHFSMDMWADRIRIIRTSS